ncbi:hypothetical protein GC175_28405 [bacterium]|nr:hypothetical protein [bacterium]
MDKAALSSLIAFNFWANNRILATCERISADDFVRTVTPNPGWRSLREILVHVLDTEYGWRSVLQSQDATTILDAADFADVAALTAHWQTEQAAWFAYDARLRQEDLDAPYDVNAENGLTVWQRIAHVVMHGIQHRSEAAAILTGYGQSPGELDFDVFLQEKPGTTIDGITGSVVHDLNAE